jgi:aminotransferase EvaB
MYNPVDYKIPFLDISRKVSQHREGISIAIENVLASSKFILGEFVENFEADFANYLGVSSVVGCANGSDALEIALKSLGLSDRATILTTANAGNYSALAIKACGMKVKFLDIDPKTWNVGVEEIQENLDNEVEAIIVTHLYGVVNKQIHEIEALCRSKNIKLIEDCAQAHGAVHRNRRIGSFGDVSTFSFYPTKNLGALGDGGAIATSNPLVASNARKLRQYGWGQKYHVDIQGGCNSRLDAIQASILSYLLPFLDKENEKRRNIAGFFHSKLKDKYEFQDFGLSGDVFHLLPILSPEREKLIEYLSENGVETQIHYPLPDHLQLNGADYDLIDSNIVLPITEGIASTILSLPCYPYISELELNLIVALLQEFRNDRK